jgi:hypothetical protein
VEEVALPELLVGEMLRNEGHADRADIGLLGLAAGTLSCGPLVVYPGGKLVTTLLGLGLGGGVDHEEVLVLAQAAEERFLARSSQGSG